MCHKMLLQQQQQQRCNSVGYGSTALIQLTRRRRRLSIDWATMRAEWEPRAERIASGRYCRLDGTDVTDASTQSTLTDKSPTAHSIRKKSSVLNDFRLVLQLNNFACFVKGNSTSLCNNNNCGRRRSEKRSGGNWRCGLRWCSHDGVQLRTETFGQPGPT